MATFVLSYHFYSHKPKYLFYLNKECLISMHCAWIFYMDRLNPCDFQSWVKFYFVYRKMFLFLCIFFCLFVCFVFFPETRKDFWIKGASVREVKEAFWRNCKVTPCWPNSLLLQSFCWWFVFQFGPKKTEFRSLTMPSCAGWCQFRLTCTRMCDVHLVCTYLHKIL